MKKREVDVPTLFRLWIEGKRPADICRALDIPRGSFSRVAKVHKLPPRNRHIIPYIARAPQEPRPRLDTGGRGFEPRVDPTPEEIIERAKWIRENIWTQERRDGAKRAVSEIPCYSWSQSSKRYSVVAS